MPVVLSAKTRQRYASKYKNKKTSSKIMPFYKSIPRTTTSQDGAMPKLFKTSLKYREAINYVSTGSAPNTYVFRANDLFDPNVTSTGHQPRGFDQMMQWYNHFTVMASKIEVRFSATTTNTIVCYGVQLSDGITTVGTSQDWAEQPRMVTTVGNAGQLVKLTYNYDTCKFFGITAPVQANQFHGTTAASPGEQAYFHILTQPVDPSQLHPIQASVLITYQVIFHGPRLQASS